MSQYLLANKKTTCASLDMWIYHNLCELSMIKKYLHEDSDGTQSAIVNKALYEYFVNHKEELLKLVDAYHQQGGCGDLDIMKEI